MKSTVRILLTALTLAVMASVSVLRAQEGERKGPPPGQRGPGRMLDPEQRIEHLDKALSLTADQKTRIRAIYAQTREEIEALAPEDRRAKGREILEGTRDQVRATLTADQQKKFDAMPRPGMGGPRGEGRRRKSD